MLLNHLITDESQLAGLMDRAFLVAGAYYQRHRDKRGQPIILHAVRVMHKVEELGPEHMMVALLHDTIEENRESLLGPALFRTAGFPETTIQAISDLTRSKDEPYFAYIKRLFPNVLAREVKLADLEDNMDPRRDFPGRNSLLRRYRMAYYYLRSGNAEYLEVKS